MGNSLKLNAKLLILAIALFAFVALIFSWTIYVTVQENANERYKNVRKKEISSSKHLLKNRIRSLHSLINSHYNNRINVSKLKIVYQSFLEPNFDEIVKKTNFESSFFWEKEIKTLFLDANPPFSPDFSWRCDFDDNEELKPNIIINSKRLIEEDITSSFLRDKIVKANLLCHPKKKDFILLWIDFPFKGEFNGRIPVLVYTKEVKGIRLGVSVILKDLNEEVSREIILLLRALSTGLADGYVWVIGFSGSKDKMVMHPQFPYLEGRPIKGIPYETKEGMGDNFLLQNYRSVKLKGEGIFYYLWPDFIDNKSLNRKMSYVKVFRPLNWIIGSGISLEDVEEIIKEKEKEVRGERTKLLERILFLIGVMAVLLLLILIRFLTDLNYQRRSRRILKANQKRLNLALKGSNLSLWELDIERNHIYCDFRWREKMGLLGSDMWVPLDKFFERVHIEDLHNVKKLFAIKEKGVLETSQCVYRMRVLENEWRFILSRGQVVEYDLASNPKIASGTHLDITDNIKAEEDKKRLEAGLREVKRLEGIGRLAGGIAHDLNNMLSPIIGYSDMLLLDMKKGETGRNELEAISVAASKAKKLIMQLMAVGRRQVLRVKVFDINQLIRDIEILLTPSKEEKIKLHISLDRAGCNIKGDSSQIEQVIFNMVINAKYSMPEGGDLYIETKHSKILEEDRINFPELKPGEYVLLTIKDTGSGISKEYQDKIFEPFFTTREIGKGTGLGLAAVKGVVGQHGGSVRVKSKIGEGSSFYVYFPSFFGQSDEEIETHNEPIGYSRGEIVLIVESDKLVRDVACEILKQYGYRVVSLRSEKEALDESYLGSNTPDILLTNILVDGVSNLTLYEELKKKFSNMKVLFMVGRDDVLEDEEISKNDFSFIKKPFTVGSLSSKIREVLRG